MQDKTKTQCYKVRFGLIRFGLFRNMTSVRFGSIYIELQILRSVRFGSVFSFGLDRKIGSVRSDRMALVMSDSNSGDEHVQDRMFLDVVDSFLVGDLNKENMIYLIVIECRNKLNIN